MLAAAGLAVYAALAAYAAWSDLARRLLPNWLCALACLAGLVFALLAGGWPAFGWALLHGLVALLVGMGLFAARLIGGGDAKFYAAVAAWFPLSRAPLLLFATSLAGLVLTLAMWRRLKRRSPHTPGEAADRLAQVPYGVAIAIGGLATLARTVALGA